MATAPAPAKSCDPLPGDNLPACRGGAPEGNANAVKHGMRAGLTSGSLPKGCEYIVRTTNEFRQTVETATLDTFGEISLLHAAAIKSAVRWERVAQLAQRWLRVEAGSMTPDQRLSYAREVARASSERDKCLRSIGLDASDAGAVATIPTFPQATPSPQATPPLPQAQR